MVARLDTGHAFAYLDNDTCNPMPQNRREENNVSYLAFSIWLPKPQLLAAPGLSPVTGLSTAVCFAQLDSVALSSKKPNGAVARLFCSSI